MRESTGTLNTFRYMIAFILIFASFLALTISYNKTVRLKNESLLILEQYEGATEKSLKIINNYLYQSGYRAKSKCDEGEYGITEITGDTLSLTDNPNDKAYYCIKRIDIKNIGAENPVQIYYDLKLFYKFDLPLFDGIELMNFKIQSETKRIAYHNDLTYKI